MAIRISLAALALLATAASAPAFAAGDVEAGKNVFKKCQLCHTNEEGKNKIGPSLFGIVGRHSASIENFSYSAPMKAFDKVWTPELLESYLVAPQKMVVGTKMAFPGLPNEKDRQDVVAYLQTLKK